MSFYWLGSSWCDERRFLVEWETRVIRSTTNISRRIKKHENERNGKSTKPRIERKVTPSQSYLETTLFAGRSLWKAIVWNGWTMICVNVKWSYPAPKCTSINKSKWNWASQSRCCFFPCSLDHRLLLRLRYEIEQQFTERNKNLQLVEMRTQGQLTDLRRMRRRVFRFCRRSQTCQWRASVSWTSENGSVNTEKTLFRSRCKEPSHFVWKELLFFRHLSASPTFIACKAKWRFFRMKTRSSEKRPNK